MLQDNLDRMTEHTSFDKLKMGFEAILYRLKSNQSHTTDNPAMLAKILMIDDDASYGNIIQRRSAMKGIDLVFCSDIEEVLDHRSEEFDMALIDYNLGPVTGIEFSEYISQYKFGRIPVLIMSGTQQFGISQWPSNARHFIHKKVGPDHILEAAMEVFADAHGIEKHEVIRQTKAGR